MTMQKGCVMVDVAIDQGECFETSKHTTTHSNSIFTMDGIVHYCVNNMPGAVAKTSTLTLTNTTLPYAVEIANKGWQRAIMENPEIRFYANVIKERFHAERLQMPSVADVCGTRIFSKLNLRWPEQL